METNSLDSLQNCSKKECIDNLVTIKVKTQTHSRSLFHCSSTWAGWCAEPWSDAVTMTGWTAQTMHTLPHSISSCLVLPIYCLCLYCACTLDNVHCCKPCCNLMLQYFIFSFVNIKWSRGLFVTKLDSLGNDKCLFFF